MKRIHITESQLNELRKRINEAYTVDATQELEQNGGNAKKAADALFAKNPNLKSDANRGEANVGYNPTALEEGCFEDNAHSDSYTEAYNYLMDLRGTEDFYRLTNMLDGNIDEEEAAIDEIAQATGVKRDIAKYAAHAVMSEVGGFGANEVMEARRYTKKQIKEAKLRKLKKECKVYSKKDLI